MGFQPDWEARVLADRAFAAAGLPHRVELEVNDVPTLLDLAGYNLGVVIVPARIAAKKRGKLHVPRCAGITRAGPPPRRPWRTQARLRGRCWPS